jgi:hypothetical protein
MLVDLHQCPMQRRRNELRVQDPIAWGPRWLASLDAAQDIGEGTHGAIGCDPVQKGGMFSQQFGQSERLVPALLRDRRMQFIQQRRQSIRCACGGYGGYPLYGSMIRHV